jgi:hypothetical protein
VTGIDGHSALAPLAFMLKISCCLNFCQVPHQLADSDLSGDFDIRGIFLSLRYTVISFLQTFEPLFLIPRGVPMEKPLSLAFELASP